MHAPLLSRARDATASSIKAIYVMNFAARTGKKSRHPRDTERNVIKAAIEFPVVARASRRALRRASPRPVSLGLTFRVAHSASLSFSVKISCVKRD